MVPPERRKWWLEPLFTETVVEMEIIEEDIVHPDYGTYGFSDYGDESSSVENSTEDEDESSSVDDYWPDASNTFATSIFVKSASLNTITPPPRKLYIE